MHARLTINDLPTRTTAGNSIQQAAAEAGITIPTLCFHPDLSVVGSCRLCVVQVDDNEHLVPACATPVVDGMVIETEAARVVAARRFVLKSLLQNYVGDLSPRGSASPHAEFLRWVRHYGVERPDDSLSVPRFSVDSDSHPLMRVDLNQCILCTRCVRACAEVQGRFIWNLSQRGHDEHLVAGVGTGLLDAGCESCGACAAYCPTGAIADRWTLAAQTPDRLVTTTCGYCGVGCQFDLNVQDERVIGVTSNPAAPVNGLALCAKGRYGSDFLHHPDRLTRPRVRQYLFDGRTKPESLEERGPFVDVDWDVALRLTVDRLTTIHRESGSRALGFLSSAKCTNEENYLLQKLARQVFGTHNIDHCARLCHSSTVAGLAMCFGSGAMSNSMDDVAEQAAAFFVIGSNTTEQHPVFGAMLRQAVHRRGARLIVADPRRINLCDFATLHLRHRPGTDTALVNGLMHLIVKRGWHDRTFIDARCEEFAPFAESLDRYTPEFVSKITGVLPAELCAAAELLAQSKPLAVIWAMGITQHTSGVLNVLSLGNLQMLLGNIGIAGSGVNPLRGQNNVQGACDMGALPNVFPGYQSVTDVQTCLNFRNAWRCVTSAERCTPSGGVEFDCNSPDGLLLSAAQSKPGKTVTELLDGAVAGWLRGLYVLGEDPALTEPDSNHARRCLASAEFLVLQEILVSETAPYADVLLPGAAFAEKDGTFTNTERRIQIVRKAIQPPGEARQDWAIIADVANRSLTLQNREPAHALAAWDYEYPAEIMDEIAELTPIYGGVNHARLVAGERLQWPIPNTTHPGTPILHVTQFTRGRGRFHVVEHLPASELPDLEFPLLLTTGRVLVHWHGGELTRRVPGLSALCPQPLVEINPSDAARHKIVDGDAISIESRRGLMIAWASVTERVAEGIVFGNFHFAGAANVNNLTHAALDPIAKIPEYKVCAVRVSSRSTSRANSKTGSRSPT